VLWFFATVSPMTEDQFLMVARNITAQKQAEEALRKNNALLERIFSSTESLIAYMDTDFNFIRVNRAYAEGDQQTPEYFVGKNHFALYPNEENEKIFRNVLATGEPFVVYAKPFVYANHPERGTTYWNWTLQPVKEADGSITGLVMSMADVTAREQAVIARHESDERYRTLVQQASDGIFVADPQGNYIDVNPSGCAMLGFTREELLQLNMRDLASPKSQVEKPRRMDLLQNGKSITLERSLITKEGAALPVEISGTMLENGNLLGIVRDITERKRHELEREAIITVSASLRQASTRTEIISIILDKLLELFDADGTVMVLPDPLTGGYIDEMGRGEVGERMIGLNVPPGKGVCNWVIENKRPYLNNQAQNDPFFYRPDLLEDSHCLATVPLITNEQVIGALWIARKKEITDADLSLLNAIADIAANAIHRVILHEQTQRQLQHLIALHQIDLAITTNLELNVTLDVILTSVKSELDVDAAAILLLDPITHTLDHTASMGFKTRTIERSRVKLADGCAGLAAREQCIVSHPDLKLVHGSFSRSSLLLDENFTAYFAAPLISKGQVKGVLEVFKHNPYEPDSEWLSYFETLATQSAIAIESANMFKNLQRSNSELTLAYDATIEGWSLALDLRDKETEGHSQRVTEMTLLLAEKIGMLDVEKLNLKRGALLHDIGKMGIPDSILLKTGTLTLDEMRIMRQHPIYAYQMLSPIAYLKHAVEIPYCHHEKWDGSGYPRGLKGEEIPLSARLFTVVDVFDALSSDRPYRKAWSREEILRYIEEQSGKHFDPKIAKIFLEMIKDRS
jgi:PAS domain S-box-containing protein/putative nucleotidyltransferase with HDIG domain